MTVARQVLAGRTHLVSRRCTQRQFLLRPDGRVNEIYLYCLAVAAERYNVTLHSWMAEANHHHLICRDNEGNLPAFVGYFHMLLAKCINAYRGRWEAVFASEQVNVVHLVEADDRFGKSVYALANPVKDHLVDRVSDWPGASSLVQQLTGRAKVIRRPRIFFRQGDDATMPEEVTLRVERPDGFEHLSEEQWARMLRDALTAEERRAREERQEKGMRVLGRKAVLRAEPTARPSSIEPRRRLRPHLACRNTKRRIAALRALKKFRADYRIARRAFASGHRDVVFPVGTYLLPRIACARVRSPAAAPS